MDKKKVPPGESISPFVECGRLVVNHNMEGM